MFVSDGHTLEVSFPADRDKLADLTSDGVLATASHAAYSGEVTGPGTAPPGLAPVISRLTAVRIQMQRAPDDSGRFAVRWEITGADGGLFPVLHADLTVAPAGQHASTLTLAGAYRPPGTPCSGHDRVSGQQLAAATIRAFLQRVAAAIDHSAGPAPAGRRTAESSPVAAGAGERARSGQVHFGRVDPQ